jgi:hypothetical protein
MSTILEPARPPSTSPSRAPLVLRTRHQWLRWRGPLIVGIVGLSATLLVMFLAPRFLHPLPALLALEIWAAGIALTALLAGAAWWLAPASLVETAQHLDTRFAAKNRLEAAVALVNSESPLAQAHRQEIEQYLEQKRDARPVRILPWLAAAVGALLIAHLLLLAVDVIPALIHPPQPKAAGTPPPKPKDAPTAGIDWVSPGAEAKANPVEEVPTVANERSSSGMTDLTLEISVNGAPKKSIKIPADPFKWPGRHTIRVSLYMDDLNVQPFDIVSYYLRGQRIYSQKLPDVTSPIQFVQVRPFRDDFLQGGGHSNKAYDLLIRLKLAQLRAVKENFVLVHTDLDASNPVRKEENDRVGKNQVELAGKADEIIQLFITEGYPAAMVDLMQKTKPKMEEAGKKILATQNAAALLPQQEALNDIIEVEKFFHKAIGPMTGPSSENPNDPFRDKQKHELRKRLQAPSGQLETLVKNQQHVAADVSKGGDAGAGTPSNASPAVPGAAPATAPQPPDANTGASGTFPNPGSPAPQTVDPFGPDADKGTLAERQTRVVQGIGVLENGNKVFPAPVNSALAAAQKDASDSLRALRANDTAGAREPSLAAARDLQNALDAMNASGDKQTRSALTDAQEKLNDLAGQLRSLAQNKSQDPNDHAAESAEKAKVLDIAKGVSQVRQDLEAAADEQQAAGSASDAEQLNHLAEQLQQQHFASELAGMNKTGVDQGRSYAIATMLEDLAGQAAHGLASQAQASAQDYISLVNELERTRANLAYLAQRAGGVAPGTLPPSQPVQPGAQPGGQPGAAHQPGQPVGQQANASGKGQPAGATGQGQPPGQPGQNGSQGTQAQAGSPGQSPSPGQPGQAQAQGQGQGQSPQAQGQGQGHGQGQGQGTSMSANVAPPGLSPGQGQGQSQTQGQGQGHGQGQGQGQSQAQSQGQGQRSSSSPSGSPGQGSGSGESASQSGSGESASQSGSGQGSGGGNASGGTGQQATDNHGQTSPGISPNQATQNGTQTPGHLAAPSPATLEAYREAIENLKSQAQQTANLAPSSSLNELQKTIIRYDKDTSFRPVSPVDIVRFYTDIEKPLERLILDLQKLQVHAQRTEIVKTPDLNETPAAYRPAVSDYFEALSRDYHPPAPEDDAKPDGTAPDDSGTNAAPASAAPATNP